ncbi:hypothetical protein LGM43_15630 [Burkholderia seminalis]|uniref:MarC family protein n=1 Tax=Burkholderia seminalis TaxID=488731 RepID=UPI001CF5372B|nr:MarC family protein [Burkholderia seminalis]MCA7951699.1 hypothetical protein [Burkholderia seminalis]
MGFDLTFSIKVFAALFAIMNPIANIPVFLSLTDRVARRAHPGAVALGLAATQLDIHALSAALAPFGGEVTDTTLSIDDELKLVEAISNARDGGRGAATD